MLHELCCTHCIIFALRHMSSLGSLNTQQATSYAEHTACGQVDLLLLHA